MPYGVYLDTSALLAVGFRQQGNRAVLRAVRGAVAVVSSDLLISEATAAFVREKANLDVLSQLLDMISIVTPTITKDLVRRVLREGYLRGADVHHLAAALWFCDGQPKNLAFITLDQQQGTFARTLGFR